MLVLSYLWLLALIPWLTKKDDPEVQWHAKYGLVLTAAEVVVYLAVWILGIVMAAIFDFLGCLGCTLYLIVCVGVIVLHVLCITKALKGERLLLPVLSDLPDKF